MKTIYIVEWNNGLSYDDQETVLVGIFTSHARAEEAGNSYDQKMRKENYSIARMGNSEVEIIEGILDYPLVNL